MWIIPFTVWTQNYYGQGRVDDTFHIDCDTKEDAVEEMIKHVNYNYPHGRLDFSSEDIRYEELFDEEDWDYDEWYDDEVWGDDEEEVEDW